MQRRSLVGIDIDDVKADFNLVLQAWHNERYGTALTRDQIHTYDLWNVWGCSKDEAIRRVVTEFYPSRAFGTIVPYRGAQEGIFLLRPDYDLISISARPVQIHETTRAWVHEHFPRGFGEVICTGAYPFSEKKKQKVEVCCERGVRVMVEDAPNTAVRCYEAGIDVVLLNQPWNVRVELPSKIVRVDDWDGIVREVRRLAG